MAVDLLDQNFNEEEIAQLRSYLADLDQQIQLPERLRSENLLALLDQPEDTADEVYQVEINMKPLEQPKPVENPQKPPFHLGQWLLSRKAVPVYSLVLVAVLALMIVPSMLQAGQLQELTLDGVSQTEQVNASTAPEMAMDFTEDQAPVDINDSAPALGGAGSEILENTPKEKGYQGEDLTTYSQNAGGQLDSGLEDPLPEVFAAAGGDTQDKQSTTRVGETPYDPAATGQTENVSPAAAPPLADSPPRMGGSTRGGVAAYGGAGSSYFIGEGGGYLFYWRTADQTDPDNEGSTIMLEVFLPEDGDPKLAFRFGMSHIYQMISIHVVEDYVYIVGVGPDGGSVAVYSGLSSGKLQHVKIQQIVGVYRDSIWVGPYLYLISSVSDPDQITANKRYTLADSGETSGVVVTTLDSATNALGKLVISGVSHGSTIRCDSKGIGVSYTNLEQLEAEAFFQWNGTALTLEKSV